MTTWQDVSSPSGPWVHYTAPGSLPSLLGDAATADVLLVELDGARMHSLEDLYREYVREFAFPEYFGWCWPAFDECMTDLNGQPARAYLTIIRMVEELGALAAEVRLLIPRVPVRVGPSWRSSPVCATRAAWAPVRGYASWATDLTANQNIEEGNLESDAAFVRLVEGLRTRARMYVPDDRFATLVAFVEGVDIGSDGALLRGFNEWLQERLLGYQTNFHWAAVIRSHVLSDELVENTARATDENFDRDASQELTGQLLEFLLQRPGSDMAKTATRPAGDGLEGVAGPMDPGDT